MFRIKICGITNVEDAIAAGDAGADAIGLNFFPKSSRFVAPKDLKAILDCASARLLRVGVFVNEEVRVINNFLAEHSNISRQGIQAVQLHGDEPPDYVAKIRSKYVIYARRLLDRRIKSIGWDIEMCGKFGRFPDVVLIDSATPGKYGGTGTTVPWDAFVDDRTQFHGVPLILAGGLTPDNVAEAIRIVRPHGVDVASGVESAPGKKDPHKVRDFIAAAQAAFGA